ncbi:unnamed protein product [Notodromas monacha]|uniref:Uncharacterized protein n=1 Tax=Notodromas monacha TaxID=399045 RepID=A0A7R9BG27_9CRUS|nr:unnamed protein product [Notodromas monacha]CAG0913454.1 unnamed protein product [Notodromas monacha]
MSQQQGTAAFVVVSFVYAKLLLVACVAFLLAEVAAYKIPLYYFEGFFTYLYGVSILFLLYVFCYLLQNGTRSRAKRSRKVASGSKLKVSLFQVGLQKGRADEEQGVASQSQQKMTESLISTVKPLKFKTTINDSTHGSFFLRIGAIVFGLGTLIYCGLELGAFFEVPWNSPCHELVNGLNPALQMAFTFMQMYFIFMNAKLNIHKFKVVARFGLMHVIATNICVWLRTIVREGLKDFTKYYVDNYNGPSEDHLIMSSGNVTLEEMMEKNLTCERVPIMGSIRNDAAPYLYPIVVEYSLIAAVVLFVMWLHIGRNPRYISEDEITAPGMDTSFISTATTSTTKVDCVGASKGLFFGLLFLICSMIATILFFILIENEKFHQYAIYLADCAHSGLLLFSLLAVLIGFCRVKKLKFNAEREDLLNALCLRISAFGVLLYATFTTIAGAVKFLNPELDIPCLLVLITGALTIFEVALQVLFVSDASKRSIHRPELNPTRPGRQLVTILLLTNITMYGIYTFEAQKVDRLPVQVHFYGSLPWAVLVKITLPLCIFHRFHASVMLADIWKNGYRPKAD